MSKSRYEIIKPIGKGGMADVFLAKDLMFNANVALKVLFKQYQFNEQLKQRFLEEARTLFTLTHPNIIKASGLVDEPDMVAYAMDFLNGVDLKTWMRDNGGTTSQAQTIETIFLPALDALAYAHSKGIIHRDVKPTNFMISEDGVVKLMDFGIAKSKDSDKTHTEHKMGTPKYMSPEQIRSAKHVSERTDIYSLGVILWELISGKPLFSDESMSAFDIELEIVTKELPPIDPKWDPIIAKATQKKPEERFGSMNEFKAAIIGANSSTGDSKATSEEETVFSGPAADQDKTVHQNSASDQETIVVNTAEDTEQNATHGAQSTAKTNNVPPENSNPTKKKPEPDSGSPVQSNVSKPKQRKHLAPILVATIIIAALIIIIAAAIMNGPGQTTTYPGGEWQPDENQTEEFIEEDLRNPGFVLPQELEERYLGFHKFRVNNVDRPFNRQAKFEYVFEYVEDLSDSTNLIPRLRFSAYIDDNQNNYCTIEGMVTNATAKQFTMQGTIAGVPNWPSDYGYTEMTGEFTFEVRANRSFWRLWTINGIECPCNTGYEECNMFCYIDIYL